MVASLPALTVAAGLMESTMLSETAGHAPAGSSVVMVSVTTPAVISADDGVYWALVSEALLNVPVPDVVHVEEDAAPPRDPFNVYDDPEHIVASVPALTVASGFMVRVMLSLTASQGPAGSFVVRVSVTDPAEISAADGVYTGFSNVALLNVPVPEVDHVDEVALPPLVPFNVYVLPEQIAAFVPALTVAAAFMVSIIVSPAAVQTPGGSSVVIISLTEPEVMSDADGVYVAFRRDALLNVPLPEVVQVDDVEVPPRDPLNM